MPVKCFNCHDNQAYECLLFGSPAPKAGYTQGVTSYTQTQQTRQVTVIKPAAPSPATSSFSIYPVTSTVQPVAAAASVVPSYSQSPTYSTNAVTYSGKCRILGTCYATSQEGSCLRCSKRGHPICIKIMSVYHGQIGTGHHTPRCS